LDLAKVGVARQKKAAEPKGATAGVETLLFEIDLWDEWSKQF